MREIFNPLAFFDFLTLRVMLIVLVLFATSGYAQTRLISGSIINKESGNPVGRANIYVSGSSLGTSSGDDGKFILELPRGIEEIFITHISYQTHILFLSKKDEYNISMIPQVNKLYEVEVNDEVDKEWQRNLKKFQKAFLGNSINAGKCSILNPWVIDFTEESHEFKATAKAPLEIENMALGYRIYFYLGHFSTKGLTVSYSGKYRFEVLDSSNGKESRKWVKNRELVYLGSLRHFLYAIANEELSEQGFVVHFADLNSSGDQFSVTKLALEDELIHTDKNTNQQYIDFNGFIRVLYTEGWGSGSDQSQTSYLYAKKRITIFRNGLSPDDEYFQEYGFWSKSRVAELLPINYRPGQ